MTVTMYVTRAIFICYEGQKSGYFEVKTCVFPPLSKDERLQIPDFQYIAKTSKYGHIFNQLSSYLKICPYFGT